MGRLAPAMAAAALVSALLAVSLGGVVRVTGSGLGCPDWPLCYGSVIPPWELEAWLEYIHRLSAAVSGVFTFLMVATILARYGLRSRVFLAASVAGVLLLAQAALGAFTVLSEIEPGWALLHTGVATGLVGVLSVIVAWAVRPQWLYQGAAPGQEWDGLRRMVMVLVAASFVLILSGAYVTRSVGAPLACTVIPLCNVPPWDMVGSQWIHMAHRILAFLVGVLTIAVLWRAAAVGHKGTQAIVSFMAALLLLQVLLGIGNVLLRLPPDVRAAHLVAAILFFATAVLFLGRLWGSGREEREPVGAYGDGSRAGPGGIH